LAAFLLSILSDIMKNVFYPVIFFYLICLCACSSTNRVYISVKEPAPVSLPEYVKKIAIINRTIPDEKARVMNKIHQVISLENENLIREGSSACVNGLVDELLTNQRLTHIVRLDSINVSGFGAGVFPSPLDWEKIEEICKKTNTDAVFSLELFDTESKLNYSTNTISSKTIVGTLPVTDHQVQMTTIVKTGWRMYDPISHFIIDESQLAKDIIFTGRGINPVVAARALIGKKEAVKQVGLAAGHLYGTKINPFWLRVYREYFVRGKTGAFGIAKRKAQTGNWDGAAQIWMEQTKSLNRKTAGRACYNMAIINEINGDLDAAQRWAQKSYENYRIKLGLDYVNILQRRMAAEELLASQVAQ